VGATAQLVDIQRVQEPGRLSAATLAGLRESAERAAGDYSLMSWAGLVPEELLEQVAQLFAALSDAPRSEEQERPVWDARRMRERVNELRPRFGLREYSVAARHDASGDLAALTQLSVDPADPGWGHQQITAVTRKHRGHRLGLLVKTAMLEMLRTAEPQIERIDTWNAEANRYMIAVNEALGYRIIGQPVTRWRLEVSRLAP
jgi:RimJ/RimL family protein N-acetyltransferase